MQSKAAPSKEIRSPASGLQVQTPSPDGEAEGKVEEEAPEAAQALEGVAVRIVTWAVYLDKKGLEGDEGPFSACLPVFFKKLKNACFCPIF